MGWIIGRGNSFIFRQGGGNKWSSYCTPLNLVLAEIIGGVRLTWEQDAKCTTEDGFEIWISIDGAAYVLLDTVAADVVTYDDLTDYAGSTVEYKVRAYRGTVYSEYSAEAEITIEAAITNLAVVWAEDHAVLTWDEQAGWDTEIYSSTDNTNWTLEETITTGTETTTNHCWQGRIMYFRARAKNGTEFGPYCTAVNITTPIVFKYDNNPTAALSFGAFNLAAGKTVRVSWGSFSGGVERYNDYTTTGTPSHLYAEADEVNKDPFYVKISGDLNAITVISIYENLLCYGDISKWHIPSLTSLIYINLNSCNFTGDLTSWAFTLPATLKDIRLYNNPLVGDLTNLIVNSSEATILYLTNTNGLCEFTAPPRGTVHQCENAVAGLFMFNANISTETLDGWLTWFNTYLNTHTPVRNSLFRFSGTGNGIPTGGNDNTDIVAIKAKYVTAGFTATVTVNT